MARISYHPPSGGVGWIDTETGQGHDPLGGSFTFSPGANAMQVVGVVNGMRGITPPAGGGTALPAGDASSTTTGGTTPANADAQAQVREALAGYGLESLSGWAYGLLTQGYDMTYIMSELRNQQAFKDRFPAIAARQAAGLPPLSPAEYVDLEKSYDSMMHATGLDGMFDRKNLYTAWITGEVSPAEAKARADEAHQAVLQEPVEVRAEMQRMFGLAAGPAAVAYFLDPKNSLPLIQQQLRQAEIGGASIRSTYGLLSADEAQRLDQLGVNVDQAQQGFGALAQRRELLSALPGEAGDNITRDEQFAAAFGGDASVQQRIEQAAARRRAAAAGGAQYRLTRTGVGGLGATSG